MKLKKIAAFGGIGIAVLAVGIQFVPVERKNPPVTMDIGAPAEVDAILRTSCYDCHSNETVWPWHAKVAPTSWLVPPDATEARKHLNFSEWQSLHPNDQLGIKEEMWEEIDSGHMPLWYYLRLHPEAKLGEDEKRTLREWMLFGR